VDAEPAAADAIARTLAYVDAPEREAEKDALYACMTDTDAWRPYPDTLAVVRALAEGGVPVGVVSNIGWDIRPAFRRAGADSAIHSFVLSFEHGVAKPDPAVYRLGCAALTTPCERVLFVGDNTATTRAAVGAGLPAYLLPAA
jgi:putative hydrolase of the HAD superfamily